jgi:hypothetical protein
MNHDLNAGLLKAGMLNAQKFGVKGTCGHICHNKRGMTQQDQKDA